MKWTYVLPMAICLAPFEPVFCKKLHQEKGQSRVVLEGNARGKKDILCFLIRLILREGELTVALEAILSLRSEM